MNTVISNHHDSHLLARLRELEQRWKRVVFARSAGYVLLVAIALLLLGATLDLTLALSIGQRRLLALACHGMWISFVWGFWIRPFRHPLTPEQIAWLLERAVPSFDEKLISAVELRDAQSGSISMELVQHVLADAEVDLSRVNPLTAFPFRLRDVLLPAVVGLLFIVALCVPSLKLARLVKRVTLPAAGDATVGRVELTFLKPIAGSWPEGKPIEFVVRCSDTTVRKVELSFEGFRVRRVLMDYDEKDGLFRTILPQPQDAFTYWAASGRTRSRSHAIDVLKRPAIQSFELRYDFPDYTELPDAVAQSVSGDLRGYAGTRVDLKIKASMPLVGMELEWDGQTRPVPLDVTGGEGRAQVVIEQGGSYTLQLRAGNNMVNLAPLTYGVTVIPDQPPSVSLLTPEADLFVAPDETLVLQWRASDDFGVAHQELQMWVNGSPRVLPLDPELDRYAWTVAAAGLVQGDEVEFFLRVQDAQQQKTDSVHRTLRVARGERLKQAGPFMTAASDLATDLGALTNRIERVRFAREKLRSAMDTTIGRNAYDLTHNKTMLSQHREKLDLEIASAESRSATLVANGFFPRSQPCGDLMQRYLKFNRQFVTRDLVKPRDRQALAAIETMQELSLRMTRALLAKAQEQAPYIEVAQATSAMAAIQSADVPDGQRLCERLSLRAGRIALASDSLLVMDFGGDAGKPQAGLRGRCYSGETRYVHGARQHDLKPHHERQDHTINLPNANAFNAGEPPFAATWSGYLKITKAGTHNFFLKSSGAARLYINAREVIRDDGDHGPQDRHGRVNLTPGLHALHLTYATGKQPPMLVLHWQEPGKPRTLIPSGVLLDGHADAPLVSLRALESELGGRANNFGTLDRLAKEMRAIFTSTQVGIDQLARDLAHKPAETDWQQVEALADELMQQSAIDVTAADEPLSVEAAKVKDDNRDAAEALYRIAELEDAAALVDAAEALEDLSQQHELVAVREQVREAKADVEALLAALDTKHTTNAPLAQADADALDRAAERLAAMREMPMAGGALRDVPQTRATESKLGEATADLTRAADAVQAKDPEAFEAAAAAARLAMQRAETAITLEISKSEPKAELAVKKLETFHEDDSAKLPPLIAELGEAYAAVSALDPEDRPALQTAANKIDALTERADALARDLEREGQREIASEAGDVATAREKFVAAAGLDAARENLLQPARDKLETSLDLEVDSTLKGRKLKKATAELHEALEQEIRSTRKDLFRANNEIAEAQSMLTQAEAANRHELPADELAELEETLAAMADRVLTPELATALNRLEDVRDSRDVVTELATDATQLEQRANAAQAQEMAETVDDVVDQLEEVSGTTHPPAPVSDGDAWTPLHPEPLLALDALSDKVDIIEEALAHASGASERAQEIRADVATREGEAMELIEAIPLDTLQAAEQAKLEKIEQAFESRSPALQAKDMTELANFPALEPELKAQLKASAAALHQDEARERQATAHEKSEDSNAATVAKTSAEMQKIVAESDRAMAEDLLDTLKEVADNALIGEHETAQRNLEAIKSDLGMLARAEDALGATPAEPMATEQPTPDVPVAPSVAEHSVTDRLRDLLQAAPVLASAADEELPLQARQGLLEAARAELSESDEPAPWPAPASQALEPLQALVQPLARGDFETAADLTDADAAEAFQRAAAMEQIAQSSPPLPEFRASSPEPSAPPLPMQQDAFDATALAEALHNEPAVERAQSGDYDGAAELLREQSEALAEPEYKALAETAAAQFDAAAAAQLQSLPSDLAKALEATRALDNTPAGEALPAEVIAAAEQAADAAAAQQFEKATEALQQALEKAPAEGKAPLEALAAQIEKAVTEEDAALATLPEVARDALGDIADLAATADPVAGMALAEAADSIEEQDYAAAAEQVAAASLAMDQPPHEALAVVDALDALDDAIYGDMPPEAREAALSLKKPSEEILEAARQDDYSEAAALAKAQGETEAMALFEAAADAQLEALPVVARDAIAALEKAMPSAREEERELMQEAVSAAMRGDLDAAVEHAREAAAPRREEAEAALALEDAEDYRAETIKPLEEALKDAKLNQFGHAANDAAQSDAGQEAAEALQEAEAQMQQALSEAVEASYEAETPQAANALKAAAQQVKGNNLKAAEQAAKQAGDAGEETRAAVAEAEAAGEQAMGTLEEALAEARSAEEAGQAAQQSLEEANTALEQEEAAAKRSQTLETQAAQALRSAAQALGQGQLEKAEEWVAKVSELDAELQEIAPDSAAAETARQQRSPLAEQLQAASDAAAQAAAATEQAAGSEPSEEANALKAAAEKAQAQAAQARKDAQSAMTSAATSADGAARADGAAAAEASQQKRALDTAANQARQGNLAQAAQTAKQAAKESYAALRAARAFEEAAEQVGEARSAALAQQRVEQDRQSERSESIALPTIPEAVAAPLADAVSDLEAAEADLAQGKAEAGTTRNMEQAGAALAEAAQNMAQQALGEVLAGIAAKPASPDAPPTSPNGPPDPNADSPDGGGGGGKGKTDPQTEDAEVPEGGGDLGDSWSGVDSELGAQDAKRRKMQYNDYYRAANGRYLEAVAKQVGDDSVNSSIKKGNGESVDNNGRR
jgi:hypothetical protein